MDTWYVVANSDDTQWMSSIGWTTDVDDALHFARRKDADAFASTDDDAVYIRSSRDFECPIPPDGWYCTRTKDHEGPCAANQYGSPYRESHGSVTSRRSRP